MYTLSFACVSSVVGGVFIGSWAWGLLISSGLILLNGNRDDKTKQAISEAIECDQRPTQL